MSHRCDICASAYHVIMHKKRCRPTLCVMSITTVDDNNDFPRVASGPRQTHAGVCSAQVDGTKIPQNSSRLLKTCYNAA